MLTNSVNWTTPSESNPLDDIRAAIHAIENAPPPEPHRHLVSAQTGRRGGVARCVECRALIWIEGGMCRDATADDLVAHLCRLPR